MKYSRLFKIQALFLSLAFLLSDPALALRPSQPETEQQKAGLRETLRASAPDPLNQSIERAARRVATALPVRRDEGEIPYPLLLKQISRPQRGAASAGLEEQVILQALDLIIDQGLRQEAQMVFQHTLALNGGPSVLGPIPPLLKQRLTSIIAAAHTTAMPMDRLAQEALIEWAAYRWAYQPQSPSGVYFDSLGAMLRAIVRPEQRDQILQVAREIGIPTAVYPQSIASRKAGYITPMYSIRSEEDEGIGDMAAAEKLIDWMAGHQMQQLYLMPVWDLDDLDPSPYLTRSAFAGNISYIALRRVPEVQQSTDARQLFDAYMTNTVSKLRGAPKVDYPPVMRGKLDVLRAAYRHFRDHVLGKDAARTQAFNEFRKREAYWLDGYTSFLTIAASEREGWKKWKNQDLKNKVPAAVDKWRKDHPDEIQFYEYVQFLWDEQWQTLRYHAHKKGIRLMGDMPHYVDGDAPWMFQEAADPNGMSGAPVDIYSVVGQDFGSPTYNWTDQKAKGYPLHMARIRRYAGLFDDVRADYWVGYGTYFRIPAQTDVNKWTGGNPQIPLRDLFQRLKTAWEAKYQDEPFPLIPVQTRQEFEQRIRESIMSDKLYPVPAQPTPVDPLFDRALFADGVVAAIRQQGRFVWGPNEPRYQAPAYILLDGTYSDLRGMGTLTQKSWQQVTPTLPDASTKEKFEREFLMKTDPEGRDRGDLEIWIHLIMRMLDAQHVDGPGHDLMQRFQQIVTFDQLGEIVPETFPEGAPVYEKATTLRYELALPRIRLLLYGMANFYPGFWSTAEQPVNSYGFTGTHDGPTMVGHILEMAQGSREVREQLARVEHILGAEMKVPALQYPAGNLQARAVAILDAALMKLARGTPDHILVMYQDWMALGNEFRSTPPGNALGEKWRDRMPVPIEAMLANQGELAQATNKRVQMVMNDPQANRKRTNFNRTAEPRILKMRPLRGSEHGVRQKVIRGPGEKVQVWAEVVPSLVSDSVEAEVQTTFWHIEEPGSPSNVPMRLYAVLPEGSRLYYAEFPAPNRIGEFVVTTQVKDPRSGHWLKATGPYEEPFLFVSQPQQAGLEEYRQRLTESFIHYRSGLIEHSPRVQFEKSFVAAELGRSIQDGWFFDLFDHMAYIVENDPRVGTNDVSRLFSHFLDYYPTLREKVYSLLVDIAVLSETAGPLAVELALDTLLSMDVGEVVLASIESGFGSSTGGQGTFNMEQAYALADRGLNVTVVTVLWADDKEKLPYLKEFPLEDTGRTIVVPFLDINKTIQVPVRIYQRWMGYQRNQVRVFYLEQPEYLRNLRQTYSADATRSLRTARLVSLGTLITLMKMNVHASVIETNDGFTSFTAMYLNEGDDVEFGYVFRIDERLQRTGVVHVIHTAERGYQMIHHPTGAKPPLEERDARILHDLGRDIRARNLNNFVTPDEPHSISALTTAIIYSDRIVIVGDGYKGYTLDPANNWRIGGVYGSLKHRADLGHYAAIPNGVLVTEKQREAFGRSLLEMGHEAARREFAWEIFTRIHPVQKQKLQEEFGLPQDTETRRSFIYTLLGRIEETKGHHLLTAPVWSVWNPGVLQVYPDNNFEGNPPVPLSSEDQVALTQYAQSELARGHGRDYLTALEVAFVLMPNLQVIVAGDPLDAQIAGQLVQIVDHVNTPEKKRFGYAPQWIGKTDPRYKPLFLGSTVMGSPSEIESFGLVPREAEAMGVPSHRSRRGGLRDGEIKVPVGAPELTSGFEPYHPVAWLISLRHMVNVWEGNQTLWNEFKYRSITADNRWIKSSTDYRELFLGVRREHGFVGGRRDVHLDVELPVFEVAAAINRAIRQGADPADLIVTSGFTLEQAVDILIRGLAQTENEHLATVILKRFLPTVSKIGELTTYVAASVQTAIQKNANIHGIHQRFVQAMSKLSSAGLEAEPAEVLSETVTAANEASVSVTQTDVPVVPFVPSQIRRFTGLFENGDPSRLAPSEITSRLQVGERVTYVVDVDPSLLPAVGRIFRQEGSVVPNLLLEQGRALLDLPADLARAEGTLLETNAGPADLALVGSAVAQAPDQWDKLFKDYQMPGLQIAPEALADIDRLTPTALAAFLNVVRQTGGLVTIFGVEFEERTTGELRLYIYA
ncbi:MAG: 4-alpha-glucanotransferase [Candidatus Omnitrophica bacterium]|nr:4-alpha-glucanotransferase [Candidatus Omnitrophota bacterium]